MPSSLESKKMISKKETVACALLVLYSLNPARSSPRLLCYPKNRTSHPPLSLSPRTEHGRRRLDLPRPGISGDTVDTYRFSSSPSTISPYLFYPPPPKTSPPLNPSAA
uniref:Uncharacterized protein n=1 Tax=Aegilops tauschii subsp. strangulata TaxID=200361 RepID=A0A453G7W7_AEGTS